jgi:hypothetical protein
MISSKKSLSIFKDEMTSWIGKECPCGCKRIMASPRMSLRISESVWNIDKYGYDIINHPLNRRFFFDLTCVEKVSKWWSDPDNMSSVLILLGHIERDLEKTKRSQEYWKLKNKRIAEFEHTVKLFAKVFGGTVEEDVYS